jgi:hypothetical protein
MSSAEKPYDIFLAADIESAKELVDLGIGSDLRIYARRRLCLFAFDKKPSLEDIEKARLICYTRSQCCTLWKSYLRISEKYKPIRRT